MAWEEYGGRGKRDYVYMKVGAVRGTLSLPLSVSLYQFFLSTPCPVPFVHNPPVLSEQRLACSFLPFLSAVRKGNHNLQRNLTLGSWVAPMGQGQECKNSEKSQIVSSSARPERLLTWASPVCSLCFLCQRKPQQV